MFFFTPYNQTVYFPIILMIIGVLFVVAIVIKTLKPSQELDEEIEDIQLPEPQLTPARVISKRIQQGYAGSAKSPHFTTGYVVSFLTENDETKEYSVPQSLYESLQEQQEGMLVTIDGNFFDFGDGEDV